jgi:hypothetical protein
VCPDATETKIGDRLYAAGCKQGAILRSSPFKGAHNDKLVDGGADADMKVRRVKDSECLVIISQDCDILANSEPYVEAFVCAKKPPEFCARLIGGNSSRWFLIDQDNHLVAHATRRVIIKKELLEPFDLEPWPSDDDHLDRFTRWLARRYIRPALGREFDKAVQDPIRNSLEETPEDIVTLFSNAVHEMRINKSSTHGPPFNVNIALLILQGELAGEEDDAIETVIREIKSRYDTDTRIGDHELYRRTLDEMSVAEYLTTYPLYLDYYTDSGDEYTGGAEPLPQA